MNNFKKLISVLLLACLVLSCLAGCKGTSDPANSSAPSTSDPATSSQPSNVDFVDYVAGLKLDMNSETKKQEVTVKNFIDGDTTHFNVPTGISESGVLKARYLAIDTPESTGKIEEYGKTASNFTHSTLEKATSIIVESDTSEWNLDSTGGRFLVWVWYKTADSEDYRNLNLEILQNGLCAASNSGGNRYGETCLAALSQAQAMKLNLYSGEKDPNFYYGEVQQITLSVLRTNIQAFEGTKVSFEGVITRNDGKNGIYVEELDPETGIYNAMYVYYGTTAAGALVEMLGLGNRVRIVGTVSSFNGTYQVSGLQLDRRHPEDVGSCALISTGNAAAYAEIDAKTFTSSKVHVEVEGEDKEFDYADLALNSTVSMKNLKVKDIYVTKNEDSSSFGAMTLTCEVDGVQIDVRTVPFYDADGNLVPPSAYEGKTLNVKGVVDYYDGAYQIKVFLQEDIEIV